MRLSPLISLLAFWLPAAIATAWEPPAPDKVRAEIFAWLDGKHLDPIVRERAAALWDRLPPKPSEDDLLNAVAQSCALADPAAERLVAMCSAPRGQLIVPAEAWPGAADVPPNLLANMRLYYARWLIHESLFDEAQEQLAGLTPEQVAAPAALLFYQSVVDHALLNKESGLKILDQLLQGSETSPRRYVALARLMHEDLKDLQDDTLDHIARRMEDIRRRLELGRAGPKVREQEDGVIKSLDKIIKKLEEQQQKMECSTDSLQSNTPASDSRIMGGKGPGDVVKKDIGAGSGWGDLPPKEREEAMQQIGRDFPTHYRDAIEQYFRRLAAEDSK